MPRAGLAGALLLLVVLWWLIANPLVLTLADTTLSALRSTLGSRRFLEALASTLWLSVASTVLAALVGVPLAILFDRVEIPGRALAGRLLALPIALPPLVGVLTFMFLWGESGFLARAVQAIFALDLPPWRFRGPVAILVVHTYSMYVFFYLFVRAALERRDPALEEAALSLGASPRRVFWRVSLPLLRPALAGAAVLTFMTALGSFSAPYFFGGGTRVLTTQIFNAKLNGDLDAARAQTVALAAVAIAGLWLSRRLAGADDIAGARTSAARRRHRLTGWRLALWTVAGWGIVASFLLPHLTLLLLSLVPAGTWTTQAFPTIWSLENYRSMIGEAERLRPLLNSLWMSGVATIGATMLALWVALATRPKTRGRSGPLADALRFLTSVPWAVPGTVLAVAIGFAWSVSDPKWGRFVLIGTPAILPLAYLIRSLPSLGQSIFAGLRQLERSQEDAAASLGAGSFRRLGRIVLPALRPALVAGAALAFLAAAGDFVLSIVLYTFETRPISLEILSSLRLHEIGLASAYGVVLAVASAAVFLWFGEESS